MVAQTSYFYRSHFLQVHDIFLFLESMLLFLDANVDVMFYTFEIVINGYLIRVLWMRYTKDLSSFSDAYHDPFLNM